MFELSVTLLLIFELIASATSNSLINEEVTTYIDASSQLVSVNNRITVKNKCNHPVGSYIFIVDPQWMHNMSYIRATDENNNVLKINRVNTDETWLKYKILFPTLLSPGELNTFKIFSVIIGYLESKPKSVKQYEKHSVLFSFNVYYFSEYLTQTQITFLHVGATDVTIVTGAMYKLADNDNYGLKYGPYLNLDPMSEYPSELHFENPSPFLTVEKLERFVLISHWGYVKIWENILLVHTGPNFKGSYERPTLNDPPTDTRIEAFVTTLPGDAFDVYLKDEIGLLSNFEVDYYSYDKVNVAVKPRFVLYGGWKTQYEIGYTLPISEYVSYNNNNMFTLTIPFADKIFDKMVIKEAAVHIILPEGATYKDMHPYVDLQNNTEKFYCYYLDVICREVVSFKKYNLVEYHVSNVFLTYYFTQFFLLTKPMVIIMFLSVWFLLFVIKSHITSSQPEEINSRPSVSNAIPTLQKQKTENSKQKKNNSKIKSKKR